MRQLLKERLMDRPGFTPVDQAGLDGFLAAHDTVMLFCSGDPAQRPEAMDLAVILPELQARFDNAFVVGIVDADAEKPLQARYGFTQWPSLVLLRQGGYLGCISRLQDWPVYLQQIRELLQGEVTRPPSIGITAIVEKGGDHAN